MAKIKHSGTPHYELLYLITNEYTEDELKPIIEKISGLITAKGGKITLTEEWGKKRLAYPIKSFKYGYYILNEFDAEGKDVAEIDRALRMASEILRHQIVVKRVKTAEEIEKEKKIAQKIASKHEAQEKTEEKKKTEEKEEKRKKKVDLEDLDEKLDKIFDTDDLL